MPAPTAADRELEELGQALCRSIAANRYDEARELAGRCVALHNLESHHVIMSILESARRLALVQRSLASHRLASLQSANRYACDNDDGKRYITKG